MKAVSALFALTAAGEKLPLVDKTVEPLIRLPVFREAGDLKPLMESIKLRGVVEPVLVDNNIVLSGVRRILACMELHRTGQTNIIHVPALFTSCDSGPQQGFIDITKVDPEPLKLEDTNDWNPEVNG